MAGEARIQQSLQIAKGTFRYQSQPTSFLADIATAFGPTPGAILVPYGGKNVDLSQLSQPGICRITNLNTTNYLTVGVWDGLRFYPMMELLPGESWMFRLSRFINIEFTGTGTLDSGDRNYLRIEPHVTSARVLVEAFET